MKISRLLLLICSLTLAVGPAAAAPLIMLDAGHGGTNEGARGPAGRAVEKRLTLELARRVQSYLGQWLPEVRIALTRRTDEYLTLDQRKRRANAAGAALFISFHTNASESHGQRGYETFILSRQASDDEAASLASRENLQQDLSGAPSDPGKGGGPDEASRRNVAGILADLRQTAAHAGSLRLARALQRAMRHVRGAEHDRGVRQASFDVLMGLKMPAALVEVGFIDHSLEGPELLRPEVQELLAASLAGAVAEFLDAEARRRLARGAIP